MSSESSLRRRLQTAIRDRVTMALCLALGACNPGGASPIPQPTVLEVDDLDFSFPDVDAGHALPAIVGHPGSAPAGSTIRITALDNTEPPFTGAVANDGSFVVAIGANIGDELRIEWLDQGRRSVPLDVIITDSGNDPTLELSPRFDCLRLNPGFVLEFMAAETQTLSFTSSCADPVTLDNDRTRLGSTYFAVSTALPIEVPPASSSNMRVAFTPATGNEQEDVLFLDVTSGAETIRYPVTLATP